MGSEIATRADFSAIRYAQCWEDADVLLEALDVRPGSVCLSIASSGDNALSLLAKGPARVIALDLNPVQLACVELRVAAYRELRHAELLELIGSVPSDRRRELYERCRERLSGPVCAFWDGQPAEIDAGIGGAGKFERYFALFRRWLLPLVHGRRMVADLLRSGTAAERQQFYVQHWDTWRWRLLFRCFFSRTVMGRLGRDPAFFNYVQGSVADRILGRARHALTVLDPAANPYLQWILLGRHGTALPFALRPQNFEAIRANLDHLEWHCQSVEDYLAAHPDLVVDAYNLSDIFEYMSEENYQVLLEKVMARGRPGGRLAYWNMLVPRSRPEHMASRLHPLTQLADRLHHEDKAFFYSRFVVEEIS
jgi:S-adenosylmethionine-diacylglycerol 3-amino-3-carboxypropyl transferase